MNNFLVYFSLLNILCVVVSFCSIIIVEDAKACFRRVLAGKRVSQQWVRRTLACERIDDCQYECGHEKRFTCEGFNYKIDPTRHGQGICELIDVPLSEMDLYSRKHNREEVLIYHPDYDYYERDRNACRPATCTDCGIKPYGPSAVDNYRPTTYRPVNDYKPHNDKPPYPPPPSDSSGYGMRPYDDRPSYYEPRPPPPPYDDRPPYYSNHHESPDPDGYRPASYDVDRYDSLKPIEISRPGYHEVIIPLGRPDDDKRPSTYNKDRPNGYIYIEDYRYQYRPEPDQDNYRPEYGSQFTPAAYKPTPPPFRYPPPGPSIYLDRDPIPPNYQKPNNYLPDSPDSNKNWPPYGSGYGSGTGSDYKHSSDFWGLQNNIDRKDDPHFNYYDLGVSKYNNYGNDVWSYPGTRYGDSDYYNKNKNNYRPNGDSWTRRPGQDECSVMSSQGFRLHKGVIKNSYKVPTVTECERLCYAENGYSCVTYSYRYNPLARDNCLLCDRPVQMLDYYADIEPDRDYDIYSMADDRQICSKTPNYRKDNAQCFFRAIDTSRFFKSIVRDSLNVRSVGECEMECIKSSRFTCRAYAFRYGPKHGNGIIDNCQLSDWPVRDMDKTRHLEHDPAFDIFERASYGHGCEIQPIIDNKHKKLCYLGYGTPSKLLSSAIKKVISVSSELECKNECVRYRENTPFKCYSFSYGSQASSYNCEMSDLDQGELKLNVHYAHTTPDRDYWLFAWNPFDWTCRDKVTTIGGGGSGGGSRVNNDRRMDIFREQGQSTWTQFTVSGKPCRKGSDCKRNTITGFYACEIDGAGIGSWDYCCKADHPCGYSQGFDYPWCFVGEGPDQWRTCSDRYFPSASSSMKKKISAAITYTPAKKKNSVTDDTYHQPPPRPGGLQELEEVAAARLWPVTYLYSSGPPNTTELSNFVDCDKENCR